MKSRHLIVFDMDGVLVDVSGSYRETIRQTAGLFFGSAQGGPLPNPIFSLGDLAVVKQSGGYNNDWDLTCRVIGLLASRMEAGEVPRDGGDWEVFETAMSCSDVSGIATLLRGSESPLAELLRENPEHNRKLIERFYEGDVGSGNIIKQIFQEVYLGENLFRRVYGMDTRVHRGAGLVEQELLIPSVSLLEELASGHVLGIATGRPKFEVEYALDTFDIRRYFTAVLSHDDCLAEEERLSAAKGGSVSLLKPDPFMLDSIAAQAGGDVGRRYYVGDLPDDMVAASRAEGYIGIGLTHVAADREALRSDLRRAGAVHVIDDFSELADIVA